MTWVVAKKNDRKIQELKKFVSYTNKKKAKSCFDLRLEITEKKKIDIWFFRIRLNLAQMKEREKTPQHRQALFKKGNNGGMA